VYSINESPMSVTARTQIWQLATSEKPAQSGHAHSLRKFDRHDADKIAGSADAKLRRANPDPRAVSSPLGPSPSLTPSLLPLRIGPNQLNKASNCFAASAAAYQKWCEHHRHFEPAGPASRSCAFQEIQAFMRFVEQPLRLCY
jgi:hypothetical protein